MMKKSVSAQNISQDEKTLFKNWEQHRGKIVMVVGEKVYTTKKADRVDKMIRSIEEKYHRRPLITYVPKEGTLVLPAL